MSTCDKCFQVDVVAEGSPVGEIETFLNFSAYVSGPKSSTTAVLVLTDIFGLQLNNNLLTADFFASQGYYTMMPDLFHGDCVPVEKFPTLDRTAWFGSHGFDQTFSIVESSVEILRKAGYSKVVVVGFCYGAYGVVRLLKESLVDAGAIAHASGISAKDAEFIQRPLIIINAENDQAFGLKEQTDFVATLQKRKVPHSSHLYWGTDHGFMVRGDYSVAHLKYARDSGLGNIISFFSCYGR